MRSLNLPVGPDGVRGYQVGIGSKPARESSRVEGGEAPAAINLTISASTERQW